MVYWGGRYQWAGKQRRGFIRWPHVAGRLLSYCWAASHDYLVSVWQEGVHTMHRFRSPTLQYTQRSQEDKHERVVVGLFRALYWTHPHATPLDHMTKTRVWKFGGSFRGRSDPCWWDLINPPPLSHSRVLQTTTQFWPYCFWILIPFSICHSCALIDMDTLAHISLNLCFCFLIVQGLFVCFYSRLSYFSIAIGFSWV